MKCKRCAGTGIETDHEAVGAVLRKLRESKSVSLRGLAMKMGISGPYLSDLEQGKRGWNAERIALFKKSLAEIVR